MSINRVAVISILVLLTLTASIQAQTPSVTASVTPESTVRMIAHGEALQVRMEIYSATGELVADTGLRQGSIIDWKQTDATQPIIDGDGTDGEVNSTSGSLTFQTGNVFSNQEQEQMRITPEGRVGIGLKHLKQLSTSRARSKLVAAFSLRTAACSAPRKVSRAKKLRAAALAAIFRGPTSSLRSTIRQPSAPSATIACL